MIEISTGTTDTPWHTAPLVALDLEGTGAQDRDNEAILEIAMVPITDGHPTLQAAYTTLINPERPVPKRPWISPGLTDEVLAQAPTLREVTPKIAGQLSGKVIVGHNIAVDWRLLQRRCPDICPAGLIDTLKLARHVHPPKGPKGLTALLNQHDLTPQVTKLAPDSQPHRALWDTIGAALLLSTLIDSLSGDEAITYDDLHRIAGLPTGIDTPDKTGHDGPEQTSLLDL